ncbi:hypothetical protein BJV82DRAFT_317600 [Fennellomyces sp. T-0311]|nr:hypothetical protein BJV82DRAFT_317600 [Fennellomyces sp. T-0311]
MTKKRSATANPSRHPSKRVNLGKNILNDLTETIHNAINRIDSEDIGDEEILRDSETILEDLQDLETAIRAARATAFGRKWKFVQAMEEASRVIKATPSSPRGYLIASDLYGAQGHYKSVIEVVEDGLRTVQPSNWPALYDKREEARQYLEKGVDFVLKLPSEVTSRIFAFSSDIRAREYFLDDVMTCTTVSRSWRNSVLNCAEAWESVELGEYNAWFAPTPLFQTVSTFVKNLTVFCMDDTRQKEIKLVKLASAGMLRSVQQLMISNYLCSGHQVELYTTLITLLGKQLTELVIEINMDDEDDTMNAKIPLDIILSVCPNLVYFSLGGNEQVASLHSSASQPRLLNLEVIRFEHGRRDYNILKWLIPRCPRLQRLTVSCFPFKLLPLIKKHCPKLKDLNIASYNASGGLIEPTDNMQHSGLQRLTYHFEENDASQMVQNLVPFFSKNKDTLEIVDLNVTGRNHVPVQPHWDSIASGQYTRLTYLNLIFDKAASQDIGSGISQFLRRCPMVEQIYLKIDGQVQNDFFAPLIDMPRLRDLAIFNVQSGGGLDQFFKHHSDLGHRSPLQVLGVSHCTKITDDVLHAIADIPTLQIIHFRGHFPLTTHNGMERFFRKVVMNANLRILYMHNVMHLSRDSGKELESLCNMTWKNYRRDSEEYSVELERKEK